MERAPVDERGTEVGGPSAREIGHLRLINGPKKPRDSASFFGIHTSLLTPAEGECRVWLRKHDLT